MLPSLHGQYDDQVKIDENDPLGFVLKELNKKFKIYSVASK